MDVNLAIMALVVDCVVVVGVVVDEGRWVERDSTDRLVFSPARNLTRPPAITVEPESTHQIPAFGTNSELLHLSLPFSTSCTNAEIFLSRHEERLDGLS